VGSVNGATISYRPAANSLVLLDYFNREVLFAQIVG
jgi:hypothetical protein